METYIQYPQAPAMGPNPPCHRTPASAADSPLSPDIIAAPNPSLQRGAPPISHNPNPSSEAATPPQDGKEKPRRRYGRRRKTNTKQKFLAARRLGASVTRAAQNAGVNRGTIYRWRHQDPQFAQDWRQSQDTFVEDLELEALKRAMEGDRSLLIFLLKSHKPETYNQKQHDQPLNRKPMNIADLVDKVRKWE